MKIDLQEFGAPALPEGYRYQVQIFEIAPLWVDFRVSIICRTQISILGLFKISRWKRVASTIITARRNDRQTLPLQPLVSVAAHLYNTYMEQDDKDT